MAGPSWLVDSNRIATKIRSASDGKNLRTVNWKSNPTKACPNCQHVIDNSDVTQEWPGLPRGVKFDPSDQEIMWHLLAKTGVENLKPHPFLDEFIPTVEEEDGICYTHPQNLPGVKQDGSVAHFFHRAIKAYNTGSRKRRKINGDDLGDVRWHKTGKTKPVFLDGIQKGYKKIMVLYVSPLRGGKAEKTYWVMHQYHLGIEEDEKEGEYVMSKVFYQQQQVKQSGNCDQDFLGGGDLMTAKVDPVTPKSISPETPRNEGRVSSFENRKGSDDTSVDLSVKETDFMQEEMVATTRGPDDQNQPMNENNTENSESNNNSQVDEDKWWEGESQYLLDSQQLVEGLSLCDELLQSQSPKRNGNEFDRESEKKPRLSDYAQLGPENLKKDLEECQELVLNPANLELDTPDFRLSQLEFGSQESFLAWGGSKVVD